MKTNNTVSPRQSLKAGVRAQIRHYERCLKLLRRVDADLLVAGFEVLETYENFALWLCTPLPGLGDKTPLDALRTAAGRRRVRQILNAIEHGVYL